MTKKVVLKQGDRMIIGNPRKISKVLGVIPETIRRWIRKKKKSEKNGFEVFTDVTEL